MGLYLQLLLVSLPRQRLGDIVVSGRSRRSHTYMPLLKTGRPSHSRRYRLKFVIMNEDVAILDVRSEHGMVVISYGSVQISVTPEAAFRLADKLSACAQHIPRSDDPLAPPET